MNAPESGRAQFRGQQFSQNDRILSQMAEPFGLPRRQSTQISCRNRAKTAPNHTNTDQSASKGKSFEGVFEQFEIGGDGIRIHAQPLTISGLYINRAVVVPIDTHLAMLDFGSLAPHRDEQECEELSPC